ncbi:hypothetical protein LTR56_016147 [Elasticomyces elasticus]|nr:hypothetical protein LTR56_016147 [Elasticomyces elasticus]KAK3637909.1 hypothetical protein LTR22_018047 [Elasticomyces elasticus]KAK4908677.1 hypothetical protein LTR49_022489 [Elasticomyces elasticus]KAK5762752.1 hypothetical protein LTS12_007141 [Elasticomyces elasticus]
MSEYWKSTPSYWCKFCSVYVKDTPLEKKNHEASGRHQGSIQKNLRDLTKNKEREERDKQRAKDEVARLNGLVSGKGGGGVVVAGLRDAGSRTGGGAGGPTLSAAEQRRKHAEQLMAMGVPLPDSLRKEITGVGGWEVTAERVVEDEQPRSLAEMMKTEEGEEGKVEVGVDGLATSVDGVARGVHKRRAEEEEEEEAREVAYRKRAYGTSKKVWPGNGGGEVGEDLDALLSGVTKKKPVVEVKKEDGELEAEVKADVPAQDDSGTTVKVESEAPALAVTVKQEDEEPEALPAVVFKKRKVKR